MENTIAKRTERKDYIDTIKFLLILAIYVGHYGTASGKLFPFVSVYHVCTFFLISGFWALNKREKTISEFILNGLKNYMLPWFIWVVVSTIFNAVLYSYEVRESAASFIVYFKSVRGSAIVGGMWFIPCFFLVSVVYHVMQKVLSKFGLKNTLVSAVVLMCISFILHSLTRYVLLLPQDLIFSIHCVPEYLFDYALGAVLYNAYLLYKAKIHISIQRIALYLLVLISIAYMGLVYFNKINGFWGWIYRMPVKPLHLLPETATMLMAYVFNFAVASLISSKRLAELGKATLILCLSESILKTSIFLILQIFGLTVNVANPIHSLVFSTLALVAGFYTVVPFTRQIVKKVCDFLNVR